jgi:hypothetical protein
MDSPIWGITIGVAIAIDVSPGASAELKLGAAKDHLYAGLKPGAATDAQIWIAAPWTA